MSENSTEVTIHHLVEKDPSTQTGQCSVCGLVAIRKSGNGFMCAVKKAEAQKAWKRRNPEKVAAHRRTRSEHGLFNRDYVKLTAECVVCGPVGMTPWGRGYACSKLADARRSVQEAAPQTWCRSCWAETASSRERTKVYLRADGTCPRCDDPATLDLGSQLRDLEYGYRTTGERIPEGMHVVYEDDDPYFMPEYESAVPGWRTVGSDRAWNEV